MAQRTVTFNRLGHLLSGLGGPQALGPMESPVERGGTRAQYAHVVAAHYRSDYEQLFGPLPDLTGVPMVAGPVPDAAAANAWKSLTARTVRSAGVPAGWPAGVPRLRSRGAPQNTPERRRDAAGPAGETPALRPL